VPVLSKDLPAGKYAVTAQVVVQNRDDSDRRVVQCGLNQGQGLTPVVLQGDDGPSDGSMDLSLVGTFDAGAGGAVQILCRNLACTCGGSVVWFNEASLVAVKVDNFG
jgi:hypothetical protein